MATATATSPQSSSSKNAPTKGEELFLVHLRRESAASEAEIYKHQAQVGQELWKVHCQRSRGYSLEDEMDVGAKLAAKPTATKTGKKKAPIRAKKPSKPVVASPVRYNLRSKDAAIAAKKE
ncbi:hypothetical protein IV203_014712 [Nitzschia inconspicua]|uniref:Uncharacterized protein n=1 Tax=Nitzschia inconspicua TaxID=303405 RepID=A0A9K3LAI8_9STRA|nr:hypothetical protein IV203_014712 [Nitzschia inconspicua]